MQTGKKPANATYVGKVVIDFDSDRAEITYADVGATGHRFGKG
jgi:hypothetical protein